MSSSSRPSNELMSKMANRFYQLNISDVYSPIMIEYLYEQLKNYDNTGDIKTALQLRINDVFIIKKAEALKEKEDREIQMGTKGANYGGSTMSLNNRFQLAGLKLGGPNPPLPLPRVGMEGRFKNMKKDAKHEWGHVKKDAKHQWKDVKHEWGHLKKDVKHEWKDAKKGVKHEEKKIHKEENHIKRKVGMLAMLGRFTPEVKRKAIERIIFSGGYNSIGLRLQTPEAREAFAQLIQLAERPLTGSGMNREEQYNTIRARIDITTLAKRFFGPNELDKGLERILEAYVSHV